MPSMQTVESFYGKGAKVGGYEFSMLLMRARSLKLVVS